MALTDGQVASVRDLATKILAVLGPAGVNPVDLKLAALAGIAARSATQQQVDAFPGARGYRILKRDDNIDVSNAGNVLGVIRFDAPTQDGGLYQWQGTTSLNAVGVELVKLGGKAEVEALTTQGWVNVVTGEVNKEMALEDGTAGSVPAGV